MDEPLSNLDAKLRVQMRGELIKLHRQIETTTVYVTHDQIEAMTMADRIVVMHDGYIQQVASPKVIYDTPINKFVAGFMGTPPMNFMDGSKGEFINGQKIVKRTIKSKDFHLIDEPVTIGIRPEDIYEGSEDAKFADSTINVKVDVSELLGSETNLYMTMNDSNICAIVDARQIIHIGDELKVSLDTSKFHFFDIHTGLRLRYEKR